MPNLDNLTINFIELNYIDLEKPTIYEAFSLLENFGIQYYEDKYLELICNSEEHHKEDTLTEFSNSLSSDLNKIINAHYITVDTTEVRLKEYTELVRFLHIIQSMENYENISYRLYSNDDARNIIIDLICDLVPLSKPRVMELLADVHSNLVQSIRQLVESKIQASETTHTTNPELIKFIKYIGKTPTLGGKVINNSGYTAELKDLSLVLDLDVDEYIDSIVVSNKAQAALDILSLLLVCTDTQNDPMGGFKANNHIFTEKVENVVTLEPLIRQMYQDFKAYADNTK